MLVIITNKDDLAADYLITALIANSRPYFRLNSEDLGKCCVTFLLGAPSPHWRINVHDRELDLREVSAVWFRRSIAPVPDGSIAQDARPFVVGELKHLIEGALFSCNAVWVNPIDATFAAERKLYQLTLAAQAGFSIPPTMVTNELPSLVDWSKSHSRTVVKPIFHGLWKATDGDHAVYTRAVTPDQLPLADDLARCPALFQEEILRGSDIRVTVIGQDFYGVRITFDHAAIDWRAPGLPLTYEVHEVPDDVKEKCRLLMRALNLCYGALDFIISPDGDWVFLEINSAGEWAWLDHKLNLGMRDSFIRLFYGNAGRTL